MSSNGFEKLTIKKAQEGLKRKDFSAIELTKFFLESIKEKDGEIKAYLDIYEKESLEQAEEADKMIAESRGTAMTGIPGAIKDNILIKNKKCTAASKILKNFTAPYDATVIKKLKSAGAIVLGKTNLDEFAMGSSTENSAFQVTRNPYDLSRVPGGSSGGSAATVGGGEALFALGSDTGGSIRQPASFCNVVGLKPTYGSVSRYGLIAFSSSLDQIGPLTKTVEDAEIVFDIIKGIDKMDSTTVDLEKIKESKKENKKIKIGIVKELNSQLDKEVGDKIGEVLKKLKEEKIEIKEISLPNIKYSLACYYIIAPSEASANLARYDGIRYRSGKINSLNTLLDDYLEARGFGFGKEVKRRIMIGTYALSAGYFDAYYLKAQELRKMIYSDFIEAFRDIDFIVSATSPTLPFKIGERANNPLKMYLSDILTIPASLAGLPAINVPVGFVKNLPVGFQIMANRNQERSLFPFAKFVEKITK